MHRPFFLTAIATLLLSSAASAPAQDAADGDKPVMTPEVRAQSRYVWIEDALWIEPDAGGALVLRFGQKGRLLETSPGALDRLPAPNAWRLVDDRVEPIALQRNRQGFDLAQATPDQSVQAEDSGVAIRNQGTKFGRKPLLYARWLPDLQPIAAATLTLDILPVDATHFRVTFRDKPLAGARLQLIAPDGMRRSLVADADGLVEVASRQAGQYQLLCSHSEELAVHVSGARYTGTRHVGTVGWVRP